ncbi:MAG: M28 family metallopeptidase [Candidatus Thorarchaeota archaeon]
MSSLNLYDPQSTINHVKNLAFKRYAATDGETKAVNYILKELEKENISYKVESFEWTKTLSKLKNLFLFSIFLFVLITEVILLFPFAAWVILPLDGLMLVIILLAGKYIFDLSRIIFIGKKRTSKNVITTAQAKDPNSKRPVIIFSAHHDSVSSIFPVNMGKILLLSGLFLLLSHIIINLILAIWSIVTLFSVITIGFVFLLIRNISLVIGIVILIDLFINFFNIKVNRSVGSVDNASGVSVLIELAKLVKKQPLEKTDVIFLWAGAEEMGVWGSKQYCLKHFEELDNEYDLDKSYNINIDMVGTSIGLEEETGILKKRKLNKNLNDVLKASNLQDKFPIEKIKIPLGAGSDHVVFRSYAKKTKIKGFQISCFSSGKDVKYIHSKKDTPELCSAEVLNSCIEICFNAIKSLDLRVE